MKCFLCSEHKDHRYRMTTSGGGGFCDCGDSEAWKQGPSCRNHQTPADQDQDPVQVLDSDLVSRAFRVFSLVLNYSVDLLTWEREDRPPPGLQQRDSVDSFYCMLFNDEVHTYEQVIYTLQKAVNCSQKEAVSFATAVDREGRKSVRFGDFQFCEQAKSVIVRSTGRQSKPLRVQVMHSSVVSHQVFALRILTWLSQIISCSDGLRRILCKVALDPGPSGTLVDRLMLNDSKMWKGARSVSHQLMMNSLLMDPQYKKVFALHFAQNYECLQSDYVKDDHDREFSITDLSVQIFTVPSLARMLMVEKSLMNVIIRTFLDHLRNRDLQGRFQFDRYTAQQAFKFGRVQSMIGDLKYVLVSRPSDWTDELRVKFLDGFEAFLELLRCMQGMDGVTRQVGQHIEMEPEWEAAFTLQMKLTPIISLILDWTRTDDLVLMEAYRRCLSALSHTLSGLADGEQPISLSLGGHMVETFRYQVSQEKVSIHLPLCRMLAGLHVLLSRTEVASRFPEQLPLGELSPPLLIELPLRCLVLCAQVHAGMWRRNGFSLINQIYYYHNVKCRVEMFDKDLTMLQVGASMMDPNHFLMIVLSRFELFHLFSSLESRRRFRESNKDVLQQNNTLIEEMLHLIIMITSERFVPGVGEVEPEEEVKREIIHQLCIRPMAHSELLKALPENGNKETGLERVIDTVASFRKPGLTGRGLYELKPEWSKNFNLYFHHYSRADQSKAEEAQRKIRSQSTSGSGSQSTSGSPSPSTSGSDSGPCPSPGPALVPPGPALVPPGPALVPPGPGPAVVPPGPGPAVVPPGPGPALVPPGPGPALVPPGPGPALVPPLPPRFSPLFASLVNLLQSDVLLSVETTVLSWASEGPGASGWTESMLQRVLHLVAMAMMEEEQQLQSNNEEEQTFNYSHRIQRPVSSGSSVSLLSLLESLQSAPHLEVHKDLISFILKTFSNIKSLRQRSAGASVSVMKSLETDDERGRDRDKAERKRKAELARLRREKVMAQMRTMQKQFINENKELFSQSLEDNSATCGQTEELQRCVPLPPSPVLQVCVGPGRVGVASDSHVTCILCQEEQEVRAGGGAMVLAAFVQRSTVLRQNRPSPCAGQSESSGASSQSDRDVLFMTSDLPLGIHTASCGHIMHSTCWQRYFEAVQQKEQRRQQRLRGHTSFDVENGEFLCPLCECLSNTVIPLLPPATSAQLPSTTSTQLPPVTASATASTTAVSPSPPETSSSPLQTLEQFISATKLQLEELQREEPNAAEGAEPERPKPPESLLSPSLSEMSVTFLLAVYKVGLKTDPNDRDPRLCAMSWASVAFTIQATERLLFEDEKPLFGSLPCRQEQCLSALCRFGSHCWASAPSGSAHNSFRRLYSALLVDPAAPDAPCFLDIDLFHLLVYTSLSYSSLQTLDQSGRSSTDSAHLHLLHLTTVAQMVQALITMETDPSESMEQDSVSPEEILVLELHLLLEKHLNMTLARPGSGFSLWTRVKSALLPFLRCSAMFFTNLNSTAPPTDLLSEGDQWEALCSYLSLPSNLLLLWSSQRPLLEPVIHRWCSDPRVRQRLLRSEFRSESESGSESGSSSGPDPSPGPGPALVRFPRASNRLVDLPEDYSELINQASTFTCPRSPGDQARAPTLCLVCGRLLCSQSYCCQTELDGDDLGACTYHALGCGAGAGLFLRVRECQVLFVAGKTKGCFYPPPYLDDYGETDQGLKRGNPLRLCRQRYEKIQRLWRSHSLAEVIGHAQEANQTLAAIDWQHL